MNSPFIIPLAGFAVTVVVVAITQLAKMRDMEMWAQQRLHLEEMEHQRKMRELELALDQVKHRP